MNLNNAAIDDYYKIAETTMVINVLENELYVALNAFTMKKLLTSTFEVLLQVISAV